MDRTYEVLSDKFVGGKKGDKVTGHYHPALLGVHLKDVTKVAPAKCPACQNEAGITQKAKKQTYSPADLAEHYASEHPALVAPAGEEE